MMTGFRELNEANVIYRDFQPANVFLHNDTLLIGDFCIAKEIDDKTIRLCGPPKTMAPEILACRRCTAHEKRADMWSIGVTLYMMLCGAEGPFSMDSMLKLKSDIERYSGENLSISHGV
jgi:serine/threonine protein kinase